MRQHDRETRERLLKAAAQLFADRGFKKVTVREICRAARANVASVNYHFGGKSGLYREVLQLVIDTMRASSDAARKAGEGCPPDERLRRYIHVSLRTVASETAGGWIHRLFHREMADPTPAFDALVDHAVRPRIEALSLLVAEMLACPVGDERVARCVGSIQAQWILCLPSPILSRLKLKILLRSEEEIDRVADHITDFSLAGIAAIARGSGTSTLRRA